MATAKMADILIIEDEPQQLRLYSKAPRGYRLTCVANWWKNLGSDLNLLHFAIDAAAVQGFPLRHGPATAHPPPLLRDLFETQRYQQLDEEPYAQQPEEEGLDGGAQMRLALLHFSNPNRIARRW